MTTQNLTIKMDLKDNASKGMGKASSSIGRHANKIKANMGKIGTAGSVALGGAAMAALKLGDMFKEAENTIAAGTGATGEALKDLKNSFKDVFADVPDDAATVAAAIADVNTEFGFTGKALERISFLALGAGRAMGEDMAKLIKGAADTLITFGKPMTDAEDLLNKLTVASQAVGVPMTGITDKVIKFGAKLQLLGLDMDESIALIANMEGKGLDAAKMMPALNVAMAKLSKEGVTDLGAGLKDAIDAIAGTEDKTEAMGMAMDLFGKGPGVLFADAIEKGAFKIDDLLVAMGNSDNVLDNLAGSTLTSAEKFDIMKNKVMAALEPIGGFASAAGPMLMILPGLSGGITLMSTAMGALSLSMAPILIGVIAVAAAIGLGILIWKNWDKIVERFTKKFKEIGAIFDTVKSTITTTLSDLKLKWDIVWSGMKETVRLVVNPIIGYFNFLIKGYNTMFKAMNNIRFSIPEKKVLGVTVIPGLHVKPFSIGMLPTIPRLAEGGIVTRPTVAQIGEKGPEAVIPLRRGGAGLGVTVNINFPSRGTVVLGNDMAARKLAQQITPLIRQALRGQQGFA